MNKNRVFRSCHKNVNGGVGGWDQVLTFTGGLKQIAKLGMIVYAGVHVPI